MTNEDQIRLCKNKKCQKPLPAGYRHRYCQACMNNQAEAAKRVLKGAGAAVGAVLSLAAVIVTKGGVGPKK